MGTEGDQQYEYTAYNLDVIISVGYRIKSKRGTKFRQWANKVLKEYLLRGYVVNTRIAALEQHAIDNYIDESTLTMLSRREAGVSATIYTRPLSAQQQLDVQRHNQQYSPITITVCQQFDSVHLEPYMAAGSWGKSCSISEGGRRGHANADGGRRCGKAIEQKSTTPKGN